MGLGAKSLPRRSWWKIIQTRPSVGARGGPRSRLPNLALPGGPAARLSGSGRCRAGDLLSLTQSRPCLAEPSFQILGLASHLAHRRLTLGRGALQLGGFAITLLTSPLALGPAFGLGLALRLGPAL